MNEEKAIDPRILKLNSRINKLERKKEKRAWNNKRKFNIQRRIDALFEQLKPLVAEDMKQYKKEIAVTEIERGSGKSIQRAENVIKEVIAPE